MSDTIIIDAAALEMKFGAGKEPGAQGTPEWLLARVGFCTASRFKDVMDFTKRGEPGAKRKAYLWELVCERLTGKAAQHFESAAMQHGTECEPQARMEYEAQSGAMVEQVGFIHHPTIDFCGGSPDGLVDDDGGVEFKCPYNSANHLQCFLTGMPEEHIPQVQGLMWITGRQYWDFGSFDPRMPDNRKLFQCRVMRDETYIADLERYVREFLNEVDAMVEKLK
jgi:hypothetical protein